MSSYRDWKITSSTYRAYRAAADNCRRAFATTTAPGPVEMDTLIRQWRAEHPVIESWEEPRPARVDADLRIVIHETDDLFGERSASAILIDTRTWQARSAANVYDWHSWTLSPEQRDIVTRVAAAGNHSEVHPTRRSHVGGDITVDMRVKVKR